MSALARRNGWRGFDIGERVEKGGFGHEPKRGGWLYTCDGMPTPMGCGATVVVPRRWSKVGAKRGSGWLVCYGLEPDTLDTDIRDREHWHEDTDVVLTYCPRCAAVVAEQDKAAEAAAAAWKAVQLGGRGTCPVCGVVGLRLTKAGQLWSHARGSTRFRDKGAHGGRCEGSGGEPAELAAHTLQEATP